MRAFIRRAAGQVPPFQPLHHPIPKRGDALNRAQSGRGFTVPDMRCCICLTFRKIIEKITSDTVSNLLPFKNERSLHDWSCLPDRAVSAAAVAVGGAS